MAGLHQKEAQLVSDQQAAARLQASAVENADAAAQDRDAAVAALDVSITARRRCRKLRK